jgi:hypothetical protein
MARKKVTTTTTVVEEQVTIDDFNLESEHLPGAMPAGAASVERARGLFYRSLVGAPGWRAQLRAEFEAILGRHLAVEDVGVDDLICAVEVVLMAAQYADAVRNLDRLGSGDHG